MILIDSGRRRLTGYGLDVACEIGRSGAVPAADKREGDGATPRGDWRLGTVLLRRDRVAMPIPPTLPWRWIEREDGWSDDPADPAYNRPISHPHGFSAERLWREDGAYDVIVTLSHNDPPVAGLGSAVFLHCFEGRPTAGCIAMERADLLVLLTRVSVDAVLRIA